MLRNLLSIVLLSLGLGLFAGCSSTEEFVGECTANEDCPGGFVCRSGLCFCRTDESCEQGQFCNRQGLCQEKAGCRSNEDCEATTFCDLISGDCVDRGSCTLDVHCQAGTVCNRQTRQCADGCRDASDCALGASCQRATGVPAESLGMCRFGVCEDKSFCGYGERCLNQSCQRDPNPNHCATCTNQPTDCGGDGNYCLINVNYDPNDPTTGGQYFCGVGCQPGQDTCPSGYGCGSVQLLTSDLCTPGNNAECGPNRFCVGGEGDRKGACTCAENADCNVTQVPGQCLGSCGGLGVTPCTSDGQCLTTCQFTCAGTSQACTSDAQCSDIPLCQGGTCITDGSRCTDNAQCGCYQGRCLNSGRTCTMGTQCGLECTQGACLLGYTCAPEQGLDCTDLR